jgi:hypothetical protein
VDEKSGKKPDTELALDKVETVAKRMNANKAGLGKQVAPKVIIFLLWHLNGFFSLKIELSNISFFPLHTY